MKKNKIMLNSFVALLLLASCQKNTNVADNKQPVNTKQKVIAAPPSDGPRAALRSIVENVNTADGKTYNAKDNTGKTMDCLKIIANPAGGYIGVYHTMIGGTFKVNLASSTDVLHWTWIREFAGSNNGGASQPDVKATGNAFIMVWEQEPSNHLKFSYFNSWTDLKNGAVAKTFEAPHTLSTCAEVRPIFIRPAALRLMWVSITGQIAMLTARHVAPPTGPHGAPANKPRSIMPFYTGGYRVISAIGTVT
jgi:hypothetical protein